MSAGSTDTAATCWKCGFVLDLTDPLFCDLPNCQDEACPLDHVGVQPQGIAPAQPSEEIRNEG